MRIALTTDWLVTAGGAERVIGEMLRLFPEASVFTTVCRPGVLPCTPHTSSLQPWYRLLRNHRVLLPLMPLAVESWDLRAFDVVLSSSHAVAKGCIPPSRAKHICYCHTPMRYAWEMEEQYLDDFHLSGPLRALARWELKRLRRWDRTTSKRVDLFIANSTATQERIKRAYGRDSIVLHPPVDDQFFREPLFPSKKNYFLAVGRLVPYKRFDLLIEVANAERLPLKIIGTGPEEGRLKKLAGPTVSLLGYVPEEELPEFYRSARALLFPVEEDAGIAPLEAQACGTPVIALAKGGALDTVQQGITGLFFREQTTEALGEALRQFERMEFDAQTIRAHARKFSSERFRERLREIVADESLGQNTSC